MSAGRQPNDLWCADYKGEFKLGNGRYCYPLTVSDHASQADHFCNDLLLWHALTGMGEQH